MTSAAARPLRIAALVSTYPPYRGGQGNVCAAQSAELARRGHEVTVFTAASGVPSREPGPPAVDRRRALLALGNAPLLPHLARLRGFDVVHVHQPFIFGSELAIAGALTSRIPVVSSFHNALIGTGLKGILFRGYNATALRVGLRRSARIAVLSNDHAVTIPQLARELAQRPGAIDEVPNGVDAERFSPGSAIEVRRRYAIPDDAVVVLVCAALDHAHENKRVDLAIEATALLQRSRPVHLLVVGEGPMREELTAFAATRGVGDLVTFAGDPGEALPDHFRAADMLVMPSDFEGFGLVQIEAMACAKPVVITSVAGARVVSVDGEHGLHIAPGDPHDLARAMRTLAEMTPQERAEMGARGRARVLERYTWSRSTDALERCLMAAVSG